MLFMVIEKYRDGDPKPVYRRFREKGRMCPPGARYLSSWVTTDFTVSEGIANAMPTEPPEGE